MVLGYTLIMDESFDPKDDVQLLLENAQEMLTVAELILGNDFYSSVCNRAYYAIFYAASALLVTKQLSYGKHSAVLAAFRQYFIKTGEFDIRWSRRYEQIMAHRHAGDYDIRISIEKQQAMTDLNDAKGFVQEVTQWLQKKKYI
jgi:uncharacterized protein (UPF0332 family)